MADVILLSLGDALACPICTHVIGYQNGVGRVAGHRQDASCPRCGATVHISTDELLFIRVCLAARPAMKRAYHRVK